jgi:hypothetical protein
MQRPIGVTVLAILHFIGAGFAVLCGSGFLFGGTILALLGMSFPAAIASFWLVVGAASFFAGAVLAIVVGVGLLRLRNWARLVSIVLAGLGWLFAVLGIFNALLHFSVFLTIRELLVAALYLWIVTYLLKPNVKQAFGATGL